MPIDRPVISKLAERGIEDGSSTTATLSLDGVRQTRKLVCKADELDAFAKHLIGYSRIANGRLERLLPAPHPDSPALIATSIDLVGNHKWLGARGADPTKPGSKQNRLADQSVGSEYAKCHLEAHYERPMYRLLEDAEVTGAEYLRYTDVGDPEPGAEVFTRPGKDLKFLLPGGTSSVNDKGNVVYSGDPPHGYFLGYDAPMVNPHQLIPVTWRRLPADFFDEWNPSAWQRRIYGVPDPNAPAGTPPPKPYFGCVNKYAFMSRPPGTLRFENLKLIRRPAPFILPPPDGLGGEFLAPAVEWDCVFTFRYDPRGHLNKFYSDSTAPDAEGASGWYPVGVGRRSYAVADTPDNYSLGDVRDFGDLFKVS